MKTSPGGAGTVPGLALASGLEADYNVARTTRSIFWEDRMRRLLFACALALPLAALAPSTASADVKTREKSQVKIEGMIGRVVNLFGGKAAREGIVSTSAVKGNRKSTTTDSSGQIVDLSEEKVYDLDVRKKTYTVTTFEELRRRMREAQEKAEKDAEREEPKDEKPEKAEKPQKEYEFDFDVKETGQKKQLAGYDARQVIMTVTVREKGKPLEDGGGFVMTSDSWLGPQIPALKELHEFELRYWKQLHGADAMGMSPEQMAMVMAMYPMLKQASERLSKEGSKLEGTTLASTTTFEAVKSREQMAQQAEQGSGSGGGLGGMLARRMAKRDGEPKARATVFTVIGETQEVSTSVADADLAIPADFKLKK